MFAFFSSVCPLSLPVCLSVSLSLYILHGYMQGIGLCDYRGSVPQSVVCELETQKSSLWCQSKSRGLTTRGADVISPGPSLRAGEDHCPHLISQAKRVNSPFLNLFFFYSSPQRFFKNWGVVALRCCVSFWCTMEQISNVYTCISSSSWAFFPPTPPIPPL